MQRLIRPVALILVAAAVGFLIAHSLGPGRRHAGSDALTRTASAPTFTVHYPQDWTAVDPPGLRGLSLGDRVAVGPGGDHAQRMTIGTGTVPTFDTLPAALLRTLSERPHAETVALGGEQFIRYLDLRPRGAGDVVTVYVLATTRATIVATCTTPRPDGSFTGECERVLGDLHLARGVQASEQVDAAYALGLNQILATLGVARRADGPGLLGASLDGRARSADRLARAEAAAAIMASRLTTGNAHAANATIVSSLREAASGYRALADAAEHEDRSGYEAAQRTLVDAQRRLTGAFATLAHLGYALQ
jgi:hypothetical protein